MKRFFVLNILFIYISLYTTDILRGQEINFGTDYYSYSASVTSISESSLNFGPAPVFAGSPAQSIDINSGMVFQITGVKYLDVIITIQAGIGDPTVLTNQDACAINCTVPLTLYAAYANQGSDTPAQAVNIPLIGNAGFAQFQIRRRSAGDPPGPPPTPVYEGYNPSLFEDSAYLYVYASLNDLTGPFTSGSYQADLVVNVTYD